MNGQEYAYYQARYAQEQSESDALNDSLGFPRVDKAHAKVIERQLNRNRPSWKQMQEQFSLEVACAKYEEALKGKRY